MYYDFHFNYKFNPQFWEIQCDTLIIKKTYAQIPSPPENPKMLLIFFISVLLEGIWAYIFLNVKVSHYISQN